MTTTRRFQVERVEVGSSRSFEGLVAALERKVPGDVAAEAS